MSALARLSLPSALSGVRPLPLVRSLAGLAALLVWWPVLADLAAPASTADPVRALGPRAAPSFAGYAARPLFDPSRRPGAAPAGSALAGADLPFDAAYVVRGIVSGPGGDVVILQHRGNGRSTRLGARQILDGYRLDGIAPEGVVFSRDGQRVVFPWTGRADPA